MWTWKTAVRKNDVLLADYTLSHISHRRSRWIHIPQYKGSSTIRHFDSPHSSQDLGYCLAALLSIVSHCRWTSPPVETSATSWGHWFASAARSRLCFDSLLSHRVPPYSPWASPHPPWRTPWPGRCASPCNTSGLHPRSSSSPQSGTRRGDPGRRNTRLTTKRAKNIVIKRHPAPRFEFGLVGALRSCENCTKKLFEWSRKRSRWSTYPSEWAQTGCSACLLCWMKLTPQCEMKQSFFHLESICFFYNKTNYKYQSLRAKSNEEEEWWKLCKS